jgi:hypothetical protein
MIDSSSEEAKILKIREAFEALLHEESATAHQHRSDSHFTNSRGRNVGRDEQLALHYARDIRLTPAPDEITDASLYLSRLLRELEAKKQSFRANEEDPEGFGIATLHGFSRTLEVFCASRA